jgi:hypothetical protein
MGGCFLKRHRRIGIIEQPTHRGGLAMNKVRMILALSIVLGLATAGALRAAPVTRYWINKTTSYDWWSSTTHWSATSGGAGGATVPVAGDTAIFDGANGATGNCILNNAVTVGKIVITAGYTGTIRLENQNLSVTTDLEWGGGTLEMLNSPRTLSVGGNLMIGSGASAFRTRFSPNSDAVGSLSVAGSATGLDNIALFMTADNNDKVYLLFLDPMSYTVLRSGSALGDAFASVTWSPTTLSGTVAYTDDATLTDLALSNLRFWVAGSAGTWNVAANWSTESGGAGGAGVPGTSHIAIFDDGGTGNCALAGNTTTGTIVLSDGYTGTFQQGAHALALSGSFHQRAGTFAGGNAAITVNGNFFFTLEGGIFTSTSDSLTLYNYTRTSDATFHHNNGTVKLTTGDFGSTTIDVPGSETFHSLLVAGRRGSNIGLSGDSLTVLGDFVFRPDDKYNDSSSKIDNGTIRVHGDVTIDRWARGGTAQIQLIGAGDQVVSHHNRREFWRYAVAGNAWTVLQRLPFEPREGSALAWAGEDRLFALRGYVNNTFWRYSTTDNAWTQAANTPGNVYAAGSLVWTGGDHLFALRGGGGTIGFDFYKYSITGNSWTTVAPTPAVVSRAGAALVWAGADSVYALRGDNNINFWHYSTTENVWTAKANTPGGVKEGGALVWTGGDHIYAFQGRTASFWRYSISGNSWQSRANLPGGDAQFGAALVWTGGDNILASRGGDTRTVNEPFTFAGADSSDFWRYSIADNAWTPLSNAPGNFHAGGSLARTGDWLYAIPGYCYAWNTPGGTWTVDKPGGTVILATDLYLEGVGQNMAWTKGAVDIGTRMLSVNQHLALSANATTLGVTVEPTGVEGRAGLLTAGGTVSGIADVTLAVKIVAEQDEITGQAYTILSNTTALGAEFASVSWNEPWQGNVDYNDNSGKNVRLTNIRTPKGTLLLIR